MTLKYHPPRLPAVLLHLRARLPGLRPLCAGGGRGDHSGLEVGGLLLQAHLGPQRGRDGDLRPPVQHPGPLQLG